MANEDRTAIEGLIGRMNEAWRAGRVEQLAHYMHEDMVIAAPGQLPRPIEGREDCIESYRDFLARVRITDYAEDRPWITVWGSTGVAIQPWVMAWEDETGAHGAAGQDVYALTKGEGGWIVVGRMMLEQSRASGEA